MSLVDVRRIVMITEEIFHDGGPKSAKPPRRGVIGALVAAVLGLMDFSQLPPRSKVKRTAVWHLAFNSTAIVLFIVSALVRLPDPDEPSVGGFILALIGILVVGVSGFLGGELAYRHGVRVADERDQERAYTR